MINCLKPGLLSGYPVSSGVVAIVRVRVIVCVSVSVTVIIVGWVITN